MAKIPHPHLSIMSSCGLLAVLCQYGMAEFLNHSLYEGGGFVCKLRQKIPQAHLGCIPGSSTTITPQRNFICTWPHGCGRSTPTMLLEMVRARLYRRIPFERSTNFNKKRPSFFRVCPLGLMKNHFFGPFLWPVR